MTDVFHHGVDAHHVLKDVHTLGVGVVVNCEWASDGLGKLPAANAKSLKSMAQFDKSCHFYIVFS